jgi:hypothetical protein
MTDFIHTYTRAEALQDGVLIDVSKMAKEAGHPFPTAITHRLHERIIPTEAEKQRLGQSYDGRLWDVLRLAFMAVALKGSLDNLHIPFRMKIHEERNRRPKHNTIALIFDLSPGDGGLNDPVVTIGFPSDF